MHKEANTHRMNKVVNITYSYGRLEQYHCMHTKTIPIRGVQYYWTCNTISPY